MPTTTIIVGAGSGGGALASRLTEDSAHEVVLVEAGPDYADPAAIPGDVRDASEMSVDKHDWKLQAFFLEPPEAREPQPYPRGRVVGGSSSVNAAIAQRATVEDLDSWVAAGADEWSYQDTLPYFARMERDRDYGDRPGHGSDGVIPVVRYPREQWAAAARAFERACRERGYPGCEDFNAKGSTGVGPVPHNLIEGARAGSLLTYLARARDRRNLDVRGDTLCRRVVFEGTRAVGVEVEHNGVVQTIRGDRVVLAAGAVHTPQLLMLSGIGPARSLDRLGVDRVVVNEAVGRNFQDHPFAPVMTLLKEQTSYTGVRTQLKFRTETGGLVDDMMLFSTILDPSTLNLEVDTKGRKALTLVSLLAKPRSAGWIDTVSRDPHVQPELHVNFLSEPSDMARLMESVRLAWDIATSSPLRDEIEEILFPDAETVADDAKLEAYIRSVATTSYHAAGTCRLGHADDPKAVVDQRLAVRGTKNLLIADASVMVNVTTGLTNLTAFMIGERLADWLTAQEEADSVETVAVG